MKSLRFSLRMARCMTAVAAVLVATPSAVIAQDADAEAEEAAEEQMTLEELLTIPEGTSEELIEHLSQLANFEPDADTPKEAQQQFERASKAMVLGADKLLAAEPSDQQVAIAYQIKLMGLQRLSDLDNPQAKKTMLALVKKLRRDKREQVAVVGWQVFIMEYLQQWQTLDESVKQRFLDDIVKEIKWGGGTKLHMQLVQVLVMQTERAGDVEFAKNLLNTALPIFASSDDPQIVEASKRMEGTARRLNLPGNEMEIVGVTLAGKKFDWEAYRDKVVLVDFWATWCGPCIQELPNVLAMYDAYHDRGFDVVGISLDRGEDEVKEFIEEREIPWTTLFPTKPEQRGWENPIAVHYGISGIPTAILVDRDGKVIEMRARGRVLQERLQELLGDPDADEQSRASQSSTGGR